MLEAAAKALVAVGVVARIVRYLVNRSLWRDEAALAVNLVDRSFGQFAAPLDYDQAAPLGFLWLEKASVVAFGSGEYALRLLPLLAALGAVFVFFKVARELLEPREALLALLLFSISEPLVFYASEVKQYSTDVLVCLLIVWPAARIARRGVTPQRLSALALLGAAGLWLSFPAAFVCGGVGLALAADPLRRRAGVAALLPLLAIGALWAASFTAEYVVLLRPMRESDFLATAWSNYFAPLPFSLEGLDWYRRAFFALFNDPLGLPSVEIAALLFLVGLMALLQRVPIHALLLILPVGLALLASLLHLSPFPTNASYHLADRYYPFFGRLILFSVPLLLPFVAAGIARLSQLADRRHQYLGWIAGVLLLAMPVYQMFENLFDPPRIHELRPVIEQLEQRIEVGDEIYVQQHGRAVVDYYARRHGLRGPTGEFTLERRTDLPALLAQLKFMKPGDRFWFVTLHHPHWYSQREQREIARLLGEFADPLEILDDHEASATLYRVRREFADWYGEVLRRRIANPGG